MSRGPGPGPALTCGSAAAAGAGAGGAGGAGGSCLAGTSGAAAWGGREWSGRDAGSSWDAGTGTALTSGSAGGIRDLVGAAAARGAGRGEPRKRHGTLRPGTSSAQLCPGAAWDSPRAAGSPPARTHGQTGWGTFGRPAGAERTPGVSWAGKGSGMASKSHGVPGPGATQRERWDKAQEGALPGLLRAAGLSAGV